MTMAVYPAYDSYKGSGVEWLGSVPKSWQTKRLKFVTQITKRIAGREGPDVLSITQQGIKVKDITSGEGQLAEDYSNYQLVYRGDYAMNHMDLLTGYVDISQFDGVVSPDYRVFRRTSDELDDRYLLLIFQIGYKQRIFFRYGQGVSLLGRWRFPAENFKEFRVPIPPLPEQRAIAAFLDEKCAGVDEAVRIKEEQIALLKERRQILIQHAVTRGLTPAAPMKDSGIDWIGVVPAHWETRKLKQLFQEKKHRPNLALNCGSISFGEVVEKDDERVPLATKASYQEVSKGEFLVNPLNLNYDLKSLRIGLSEIDVVVSAGYLVLQAKNDMVKRYFKYLLHRYDVAYMKLLGSGVRQTISFNHIANSILVAPPLSEQRAIAAFLDNECAKIDDAISIKNDQITAFKEYKTSLINAAVTGKIKVI